MKQDLTFPQHRRLMPGGFTGKSSVLNRWGITVLEACLCAVALASCILVHWVPVYNHLGLPIEAGLSLISFATPVSGLLYLSAAQVIPDPSWKLMSSAQMALAGFFLWQLAKGKFTDVFRMGRPLWVSVAPFLAWGTGCALIAGNYRFGANLLFAILTGCAATTLVRQSGSRLMTCMVMFLAGQALAMSLFWILKLHLGAPVQAFDTDLYGDSALGGGRIGTARGNANTLGPPMALVCIGAIGWYLSRPKQNWRTGMMALLCLATAVPPLLGSGCRGAIVALVVGAAFLLTLAWLAGGKSITGALVALAGAGVVLVLGWHRLGLDEHWKEMTTRQREQQFQGGSLYAGRTMEWTAAWNGVLDSPLMGGGAVQKLSYLDAENMWASHSTYLDAGLVGGIPGMALFCWFVFKPGSELWRRRYDPVIGWLLSVYVVSIICIGSTSAMQLKHFWMLWGMAAVCFLPAASKIKRRRNSPFSTRGIVKANRVK